MADEWNLATPPNTELISDLPSEHRQRKTNVAAVLEKEHATLGDGNSGGQHLNGAAVAYQGATAPTKAPDGSTALSTGNADKGRLYIDDNFDPPILCRWDGSAIEIIGTVGGRLHASGDGEANAYIINLFKEDAAGGRGCRLVGKGTQSGAEVTTLGYIEFAHDGAADDQKGKVTIVVNDGDDDNAPSKKAVQYSSDGKVVVANSVSVLDEDDMTSDSAVQVPTQQSVKAFGTWVPAVTGAGAGYAGEQSITLPNGLIIKQGTESVAANTTDEVTYGTAFPTSFVNCFVSFYAKAVALVDAANAQPKSGSETSILEVTNGHTSTQTIAWIAIGY